MSGAKRSWAVPVGFALILISAYPAALTAREFWATRRFNERYQLLPTYDKTSITLGPHQVALHDKFSQTAHKTKDREVGPVTITIDGKDYSDPSLIEIRPSYHDSNRYHGWMVLAHLKDKKSNLEWMVVGQRTLGDALLSGIKPPETSDEFRLLLVDKQGAVKTEDFSLGQRANPLYRTILAGFIYPQPLGFYSQILQGAPTLLFPILYPWITGIAGLLLCVWGLARRFTLLAQGR
jgi:hypothetical protein